MRYSVIFLLLMNVLYGSWNLLKPDGRSNIESIARFKSFEAGLVLHSELDQDQLQALEVNQSSTVIDLDLRASSGKCFSIGEFPDLAGAAQIRDYLVSRGLRSTLNLEQELTNLTFRVYIPPFASVSAAMVGLEALNGAALASGYEFDSQLIVSGDLAFGLAISAHNNRSAATDAQSLLREMGYAAEIEQISEFDSVIKVVVRSNENPPFEAELWPQILNERPYLSRTENLCETIAQGGQFP